jgi:aspartyl-tRNA(Asn)/glutamyl-tRNA(Gln) amidotransferase subunit C
MSVDLSHAAQIASLARLRFGQEELEHITREMNQVLEYVEELKSLEVDDVPGDASDPLEGEGDATRGAGAESPDELALGLEALGPDAREGFFIVPPLPGVHAEEAG